MIPRRWRSSLPQFVQELRTSGFDALEQDNAIVIRLATQNIYLYSDGSYSGKRAINKTIRLQMWEITFAPTGHWFHTQR